MDTINIQGLLIKTRIGIHSWEQAIEQKLLIDVTASVEIPVEKVTLDDSLDYSKVSASIVELLSSQSFDLIENVANTVANSLKKTFNLERVIITVSKPNALPIAKNVSVSITR